MGKKVGKKELAEHLGWSRSRLDRDLTRNVDFPVEKVGDQAGGWLFDIEVVDRYLAGASAADVPQGCDSCRAVAGALKGIEDDIAAVALYIEGLQRFISRCIHATDGSNGA